MNRREILSASLLATIAAQGAALAQSAPVAAPAGRLYYLWRRYEILAGMSGAMTDAYLKDAFIPAANRLGVRPIGVFNAWLTGNDTLGKYVLMPSTSAELLALIDVRLKSDPAYMAAARPFLSAPVDKPPFARIENTLMQAMEKFPSLMVPNGMAMKEGRLFEFRTYEQPTEEAHSNKIGLFENGEDALLREAGFSSILYARNLIGRRLPSLSYMWIYESLDQRSKAERNWTADTRVRSLFSQPQFTPSNSLFGNVILRPAAYSQI